MKIASMFIPHAVIMVLMLGYAAWARDPVLAVIAIVLGVITFCLYLILKINRPIEKDHGRPE